MRYLETVSDISISFPLLKKAQHSFFLEKLRRVAKLVKDLRADLKEVNFLPHGQNPCIGRPKAPTNTNIERNAAMEQLKVFGRSAANADPIFTQEV